MKKTVIVYLIMFQAVCALAQQEPQYSHDMFNQMTVNPGYAGSSGMMNTSIIYRQQWVGFTGAPQTATFNLDAAVNLLGRPSGIGLSIIQDELGNNKDFHINLAYAWKKELGTGTLGAGIGLGVLNQTVKNNWIAPEGGSSVPAESDPAVPALEGGKTVFDLGFGLYYKTTDWYTGLSISHLNQADIRFEGQTKEQGGVTALKRHYYLTGGYTFQLPWPQFELTPSLFIKSDGTTLQFTATPLITYNKKVWGGLSYRYGDAIIVMAGLELISGLKIGYAYDLPTHKIIKYSSGTHEVYISYGFNLSFDKGPMQVKSVRFL